ncbi:MAG TPA: ATP-binding cassette domain-containing protein [Gemmatimonadaceae bacterium]|nr:ATP-binding cassette domain-containing protein [Gemmatimonadaceae bacterium]
MARPVPIIQTQHLTKRYERLVAVDDLNLDVEEGEIFGLLGPNGAGKTTTLLTLTTLIRPTSGTATINGFDIVREPGRVRQSIGIVFQDPSSDDILTGYENLKVHGMLYGMPVALRERRIGEVLELVELTDRKDDLVKKYSGGMRRRLELARGLMHDPKVLFLDEPTLGLDPQSREKVWEYVENLSRQKKITVILTTHYMEEVDRLCDRLAIMDSGRIGALDTPANLKRVIGGDIVAMRVREPDLDALGRMPFVQKVEAKGPLVMLTVTDASEHLAELLRAVSGVEAVEVRSPTLDDVFLHFTGRAIREGSPEGGWAERMMRRR